MKTVTYKVAEIVEVSVPFNHTLAELKHQIEIALVRYGWPELKVIRFTGNKFTYREMPLGECQEDYIRRLI